MSKTRQGKRKIFFNGLVLDGPKNFFGNPKKNRRNPKKSAGSRKMAIKRATELRSRRKKLHEKAKMLENHTATSKMRESYQIWMILVFAKPKKKRPKNFFGYFFGQKSFLGHLSVQSAIARATRLGLKRSLVVWKTLDACFPTPQEP